MILKRQKIYSDSAILETLSNFGKILRLKYLANLGKQFWQKLKDLAKRFKHFVVGKKVDEHNDEIRQDHVEPRQKKFSKISLNADAFTYFKEIPSYKELMTCSAAEDKMLEKNQATEGFKDYIYKYFPSFQGLCLPNTINEYRKDYISTDDGDWSEILFLYGGELVYIWDFDRNSWYVLDKTYVPKKEWKIEGTKNLFKVLLSSFDREKDELLNRRLESLKEKDENLYRSMEQYCDIMLSLVKKYAN